MHIHKQNGSYPLFQVRVLEVFTSSILLLMFLPIYLLNIILAVIKRRNLFCFRQKTDALGRQVMLRAFRYGLLKRSAVLIDIMFGKFGFIGVSTNHTLSNEQQRQVLENANSYVLPGLSSLYDIHRAVGLDTHSAWNLFNKQQSMGVFQHFVLMIKAMLVHQLYQSKPLQTPRVANLFKLPINNVSMTRAVNWSIHGHSLVKHNWNQQTPQLGFFVNAHSINLAQKNGNFKSCLRHANALFADGSGMRVAAKSIGIKLEGNINGTDMLPRICEQAQIQGKSLFLLGGQPSRAELAANKLIELFPQLNIAGVHHGFFDFNDSQLNQELIAKINNSNADIVLVGLGSPSQEFWCKQYLHQLNCTSVLAVGGLFDYFSGAIPRAPMLMRELGLEWIWRLRQEPIIKFKRYVVGTPLFLIRTFLLKQV